VSFPLGSAPDGAVIDRRVNHQQKRGNSRMKTRFASLALLATSALVSFGASAMASSDLPPVVGTPKFVVLPSNFPGHHAPPVQPGKQLIQWNGSFKDSSGRTFNFVMAGEDPSKSNGTTNFAALVIPVQLVFGKSNGNESFDPSTHVVKGTSSTVIDLTLASPLFKSNVDFKQGGTDLGKTQYIDAFQRGTFWGSVKKHKDYHVIFNPISVAKLQTINVSSSADGSVHQLSDGTHIGEVDINFFDAKLQSFMRALKVKPNMLPIFVTYNTYQTENHGALCCIGGYHSANGNSPGGQTYSQATFVDGPGDFAQDVSATSHELGEWMDDPFGNNRVNCSNDNTNGFLEVGDPIEGFPNHGGFPYTVDGYTYNLQSLVFMPYFGAPKKTSVNGWYSFQNDMKHVCPGE
jgi:hypothetical protein